MNVIKMSVESNTPCVTVELQRGSRTTTKKLRSSRLRELSRCKVPQKGVVRICHPTPFPGYEDLFGGSQSNNGDGFFCLGQGSTHGLNYGPP